MSNTIRFLLKKYFWKKLKWSGRIVSLLKKYDKLHCYIKYGISTEEVIRGCEYKETGHLRGSLSHCSSPNKVVLNILTWQISKTYYGKGNNKTVYGTIYYFFKSYKNSKKNFFFCVDMQRKHPQLVTMVKSWIFDYLHIVYILKMIIYSCFVQLKMLFK